MPGVLFFLQSAFSLWMLVDAIGRPGIARYWYWVILMPFGEWFYFFKYKIHDPDFAWLKAPFGALLDKPASIEELRYHTEQTPSLHNKVRLAQALHDADAFGEASALFTQVLESDSSSRDALYGLGLCRIGAGDLDGAIAPLRKLVELEPAYHHYDGFAKLAQTLWESNQRDEALAALGKLVKLSPRMPHRVAYAHYLGLAEDRAEAQTQLTTALQEFDYAPKYLKRSHRALAKRAKEMLRQLSQ
ncbi:MAG TPA: tetratricopeptide repeat protein [Vicinamibacteria bacterium]|nr:tetratricopeptide repeat protein [Vicinamibacteria bacterium]